jgi:hypothetical protein
MLLFDLRLTVFDLLRTGDSIHVWFGPLGIHIFRHQGAAVPSAHVARLIAARPRTLPLAALSPVWIAWNRGRWTPNRPRRR